MNTLVSTFHIIPVEFVREAIVRFINIPSDMLYLVLYLHSSIFFPHVCMGFLCDILAYANKGALLSKTDCYHSSICHSYSSCLCDWSNVCKIQGFVCSYWRHTLLTCWVWRQLIPWHLQHNTEQVKHTMKCLHMVKQGWLQISIGLPSSDLKKGWGRYSWDIPPFEFLQEY